MFSSVTAEEWERLTEIIADVSTLGPVEQKEALFAYDLSPDLERKLVSLLSTKKTDEFLSATAKTFAGDFVDEREDPLVGQTIGVYRIVREIGVGGMGAVYLAERCDNKFEARVAVKLLRREFNTSRFRANFDREKSILARLSHPNIARLIDAGTTGDGIPYLVMEYVEGIEVDRYCREQRLPLIARLKLFNRIASAVSYAHRNLVVHRDLKPSNILITEDGEPKLLDFGISKLLDANGGQDTVTMNWALTPAYASPEQIRGEPLGTATDTYSLGVVLSRMLTGKYPVDLETKTNGNLLKAANEADRMAPSELIGKEGSPEATIMAAELRGDIDNIVMKALSLEAERRYESVERFSSDIWSYIDGRPVKARPATRVYRLSKFYRRNKIAVSAGVLVIVTLIGGIAVSAWQTGVARTNAAAAVAESDKAKDEQQKAEKISRFMTRFMSYASPHWDAEGHRFRGEARVIEALQDMESKIESEFADQPDILAELHYQFSDIYTRRGSPLDPDAKEKARMHALRALELRRLAHGDWHELVAKDMVYVYWTRPSSDEITDSDAKLLSDAIVMMRSTNPENLNLPYMLETYIDRLSAADKFAGFHEVFLRHVPQPAPADKYLAADQLFDEMLGQLRLHFAEDASQIVLQKCKGMRLKRIVNKMPEADQFYRTCLNATENATLTGKPNVKWQKLIDDYSRSTGME